MVFAPLHAYDRPFRVATKVDAFLTAFSLCFSPPLHEETARLFIERF